MKNKINIEKPELKKSDSTGKFSATMTSITKQIICYILIYQLVYSFNQFHTHGNVIVQSDNHKIDRGKSELTNNVTIYDKSNNVSSIAATENENSTSVPMNISNFRQK